ncbi:MULTISPECIES: hypothetical protein [unclassified Caballeronia]|uniref:hypothetical protein n=1 Tax=unclassified Caballeronia TaxID=2646786 RepID=UPI0013E9C712|nr:MULTISPECIES: hypothetical protein [unclassified Caballeronia]
MKQSVQAIEIAKVPTAALLQALANEVAQYLANATGGRVDIAMHGLIVISRMPAGAPPQRKKG